MDFELKNFGNDFDADPKTFNATFCNNSDIPIAVIRLEIFGEFLRGLYATLSISSPMTTQTTIAGSTVSQIGSPRFTKIGMVTRLAYAPIMIISPCAKFINFAAPYTIVYPKLTRAYILPTPNPFIN